MPKSNEFKTIFKGEEIICDIDTSEYDYEDLKLIEDDDERALFKEALDRHYFPERFEK